MQCQEVLEGHQCIYISDPLPAPLSCILLYPNCPSLRTRGSWRSNDLIYFQMSIWWSGVRWWRRWLVGPALTVTITLRTILTYTNTLSLAMSSILVTIVISVSNSVPPEIPSETTKLVFIKIKVYLVLCRAPRGRHRQPWRAATFQDDLPWSRSRLPMQWLSVQLHCKWKYATPYWVLTFRFELSMQFVYKISQVLQVLVHAHAKSSQKLVPAFWKNFLNHYKLFLILL